MFRLLRPLTFAGFVVVAGLIGYGYAVLPSVSTPPAESLVTPDQEGIRKIIRDYLLERPEILEEALIALNTKRLDEERDRARAAIGEHRGTLFSHSMSPVSGNPDGDVTLVEFFDYACGYCKHSLAEVLDVLRSDGQLRVVWKELPVLGAASHFAARASMAAQRQGRYLEFHEALMGSRDGLSEDTVLAIAGRIGLDVERLRRDMADPAIKAYLDETHDLARELGINGTPAFVIGDTLVPGAVEATRLKELIAAARDGG